MLFFASPVVPFCTSHVYSLEPWFFFVQYNALYRSKKKKKIIYLLGFQIEITFVGLSFYVDPVTAFFLVDCFS